LALALIMLLRKRYEGSVLDMLRSRTPRDTHVAGVRRR